VNYESNLNESIEKEVPRNRSDNRRTTMPMYLISYDLRKVRNYEPLWKVLRDWKSVRLLESLWLTELLGPAPTIRDLLQPYIDGDDGIAVLELMPNFDWATLRCQPAGTNWLKAHRP
jgi:hypothetical protein